MDVGLLDDWLSTTGTRRVMAQKSRLTDRLIMTASHHLAQAYQAQASEESTQFYLHAGVTIELLLKARLAAEHPALIADPRHFMSMLEMVQAASKGSLPPHTVKTVTISEAIERIQQLDPEMAPLLKTVRPILAFRNSAVHMGMTTSKDATEDLRTVTVLVDHLLCALQQSRSSFYGHYLEAADAHLDASRAEAERAAQLAVAAASSRFHKQFGSILPGPNVTEALYSYEWEEKYEAQRGYCPACNSEALLRGESYPEWTDTRDDDGKIESTELKVTFYTTELECRLCGLNVHGAALSVLDVPSVIELTDFDPDDFLDERQLEH